MTDFLMNQTDIMHENPRFSDGLGGGKARTRGRFYSRLSSASNRSMISRDHWAPLSFRGYS